MAKKNEYSPKYELVKKYYDEGLWDERRTQSQTGC